MKLFFEHFSMYSTDEKEIKRIKKFVFVSNIFDWFRIKFFICFISLDYVNLEQFFSNQTHTHMCTLTRRTDGQTDRLTTM